LKRAFNAALKDPTPCGFEGNSEKWVHPYERNRGDFREQHTACYANYINPDHFNYIAEYGRYDKGYLLKAGGTIDQPPKYLQAMQLISSEVNRIEKERMDAEKAKSKVQAK